MFTGSRLLLIPFSGKLSGEKAEGMGETETYNKYVQFFSEKEKSTA